MKGLRVSLCILCCFLFFIIPAAAEEKPVLSVLNFESSGLSEAEVNLVTDILTSHVQKTGAFRVIDRFQRTTIMDEIAFSQSGCVEESCQLEIGRLLSASFIITGSLGNVGALYVMNLRLIAVETGETVQSETGSFRSIETLVESSQPMILDLLALEQPTPKDAVTDAAAGETSPPPAEEPEGHSVTDQAAEKPLRHIFGVGAGYITAAVRRESDSSTYFSEASSNLGMVRFTWLYRFGKLLSAGVWGSAEAGRQEARAGYEEDNPSTFYGTIFTVAGGLSLALGTPVKGFSIILSPGILYYSDWDDVTVPVSFCLSWKSVYAGYSPLMSPYVSPIFSTRFSWGEVEVRNCHAFELGYLFGR